MKSLEELYTHKTIVAKGGDYQVQTITGKIISKSNSYRIVTIQSKDDLRPAFSSLAKTKELRAYEKAFAWQCNKYRNKEIEGFIFYANVYFKRTSSDLDGFLKSCLDMLQDASVKAIKNDNKCMRIVVNKYIDATNPRIEFTIEPIIENHGKNPTTTKRSSRKRGTQTEIPIGNNDSGHPESSFPL